MVTYTVPFKMTSHYWDSYAPQRMYHPMMMTTTTTTTIMMCFDVKQSLVQAPLVNGISSHVRQFYSRFNNMLSVIGKGSRELCTLHLNKVYCLLSLTYGCETWTLNDQSINKVNVAWNNSFRHIFSGFWWESVKPLQYYTATIKKTAVLEKLAMHNNNFLLSLSRLVQNRFYAIGSLYDITTMSASVGQIKSAVWAKFTETVWKF